MRLLAVVLDASTAGHVLAALRLYMARMDERGLRYPAKLRDLEHLVLDIYGAAKGSTGAQGGVGGGVELAPSYGGGDDQQLLTQKQAAEVLGVHPRTVRSYLDAGQLKGVGPRRRVSRRELKRFANPTEETQ